MFKILSPWCNIRSNIYCVSVGDNHKFFKNSIMATKWMSLLKLKYESWNNTSMWSWQLTKKLNRKVVQINLLVIVYNNEEQRECGTYQTKANQYCSLSLIHISEINFVISVCERVTNIMRLDSHYLYNIRGKGPRDGMAPLGYSIMRVIFIM